MDKETGSERSERRVSASHRWLWAVAPALKK